MKKFVLGILSVSVIFMFISCGSKPTEESEKPEAPVVEEVEEIVKEEVIDNESAIALIDDARVLAIDAGAEDKAPEFLVKIDEYYEQIKFDGTAITPDESAELVARYQALANYIKAADAKKEIDDNNYAQYYQKGYDDGVASLEKVENAFNNSDNATTFVGEAESAYTNFVAVLTVSYKKIAKEERSNAYDAKKQADSVKAAVSRKNEYKAAAEQFQKGDTLYAMQNAKSAYENYKSAKETFTTLYNEIYEKRAIAQAAIDAAKKSVEESANYAAEADSKEPLKEKVEGIEDEDAVLLEQDSYANPEDAEIDVAPTLEEAVVEQATDAVNSLINAFDAK